MNEKIIVHVSEVNLTSQTGMGRIECFWKKAFEDRGYKFIHIGPDEVGKTPHKGLFPIKAYKFFQQLNIHPKAFIVHEPASGSFVNKAIPCFVESHGIERRYWENQLQGKIPGEKISVKTKLLFPLWRLKNCDTGLKRSHKLLLSNWEDADYVKSKYKRGYDDILIFRNGITRNVPARDIRKNRTFTILFNGSWIERKGIATLIKASELLRNKALKINYLLIGTGKSVAAIEAVWPDKIKPFIKVIPSFLQEQEAELLSSADLFVLPSYYEGQPLSLLQAMETSKCCITTNSCGQKDIIKSGVNGFLFEPANHYQLAEIIEKCYRDQSLTKDIGEQARVTVKDRTWDKVSQEVAQYVLDNS
jgi:glycosyltransferase involved in cell wall biosynthesis